MGKQRRFALSYVLENKGTVNASNQERRRVVAAWLCLFAAVVLYAPLTAAAWSAHAMSCCTGDHCPIAEHHHHQKKQAAPHSDMDCEHDMGEMMNCSMSCCQGSDQPLVTAVAFVLPNPALALVPAPATSASENLQAVEIPRSLKPPSPPPRFAHAS
jgi:hypothetical protein